MNFPVLDKERLYYYNDGLSNMPSYGQMSGSLYLQLRPRLGTGIFPPLHSSDHIHAHLGSSFLALLPLMMVILLAMLPSPYMTRTIPDEYSTWIPGRGHLWNVHYGPTMAFFLAHPTPAPSHITPAFVRKYTDCDLSRLPNYFPLILTYFERQRLYASSPTEELSLDIANTHVSTYQLLTRLDHAQLMELPQFRSLLSLWPPAPVYDLMLNPIATEFLPYGHLTSEGGTTAVLTHLVPIYPSRTLKVFAHSSFQRRFDGLPEEAEDFLQYRFVVCEILPSFITPELCEIVFLPTMKNSVEFLTACLRHPHLREEYC
jgi:hypothetical protein